MTYEQLVRIAKFCGVQPSVVYSVYGESIPALTYRKGGKIWGFSSTGSRMWFTVEEGSGQQNSRFDLDVLRAWEAVGYTLPS